MLWGRRFIDDVLHTAGAAEIEFKRGRVGRLKRGCHLGSESMRMVWGLPPIGGLSEEERGELEQQFLLRRSDGLIERVFFFPLPSFSSSFLLHFLVVFKVLFWAFPFLISSSPSCPPPLHWLHLLPEWFWGPPSFARCPPSHVTMRRLREWLWNITRIYKKAWPRKCFGSRSCQYQHLASCFFLNVGNPNLPSNMSLQTRAWFDFRFDVCSLASLPHLWMFCLHPKWIYFCYHAWKIFL